MIMSNFNFGDIVLLQFPFTDATGSKKRPALILLDTLDGDIIVCRITSQIKTSNFDIELTDWNTEGLKLFSIVRLHKIATLENSLIEKKLGELSSKDKKSVIEKIREILLKL